MSFIKASAIGPLTGLGASSNTATIVDPATPASGSATLSPLVSFAALSAPQGASIDFIGIPSWAKRVSLVLSGVSTSSTSQVIAQIGSGSIVSSGYTFYLSYSGGATQTSGSNSTTGFLFDANISGNAASLRNGIFTFINISSNTWVCNLSGSLNTSGSYFACVGSGYLALSGALDRVRLTTNGADTFDAGTVNVFYE